ncbi:MAG TPA: hypothetical protein VGN26_22700 [Armatimonadota bacterium]|jgi:hypothetical protein
MPPPQRLSDKSVTVLRLIAEGRSYSQIVDAHPSITYRDIFLAAEEALQLGKGQPDPPSRITDIRRRHARAYEPWTKEEEHRLAEMHAAGLSVSDLARRLERQPSAIQARLLKLGLGSPDERKGGTER